jgi:hypothetical protein
LKNLLNNPALLVFYTYEDLRFRCPFRVGREVLLAAGLDSDLQLASPPF